MKKRNNFKAGVITAGLLASGGLVNELIISDLDWRPVQDASERVVKLSESQVNIRLSTGFRCSGSMIAKDMLFTNNHCVPFDGITAKISSDGVKWVKCEKLLHTSKLNDYSILRCEGADYPALEFDANPIKVNDNIYALHSNCDYYDNSFCKIIKLYSAGKVLEIKGNTLKHNVDTLGGSSGAPILRDGKIVAIHNSGMGNANHDGRGLYNMGKTARAVLNSMPEIYRGELQIKGNLTLKQNNSAPYVPTNKKIVKKKRKKKRGNFWRRVKCFFSRRC